LRRSPFAAQRGDGAHGPSQSNGLNGEQQKLSLDPSYCRFVELDSKLSSEVQVDSKRGLDSAVQEILEHATTTESHISTIGVGAISAESPCSVATF